MKVGESWFIAYPSAVVFEDKGAQTKTKGKEAFNHLLWGDWAKIKQIDGNWIEVNVRGKDGWVRVENLQRDRILEVNFVDVGQGDGCHIQTPDDRALVIDAGEEDNMYRFLRWRFGKFSKRFNFEAMVITHSDKDHYNGFKELFEETNVHIGTVYHNSIVEQRISGKNSLGKKSKVNRKNYITGLVRNRADLKTITGSTARRGRRLYPKLLKTAVDSGRVKDFRGLLAANDPAAPNYLPDFAPEDKRKGVTLKILGPVPTVFPNNTVGLPWFSSEGKTKNGHSVVFMLEIGSVSILLGGDLNEPSQNYLLEHYTGLDAPPDTPEEENELAEIGQEVFRADVAKACHHGSADVSNAFQRAMDALITVISSGDDEPHSHPRPDTLGLIGKFGRSDRPLIFCTELARSTKENIKHPHRVRQELKSGLLKEERIINNPASTAQEIKKAEARQDKLFQVIERSVANYGMINVRTDGTNLIVAQRLERKRSKSVRWDIYRFEPDGSGRLRRVSK